MPQDHHLQRQRFELKYLINENLVAPIREFVSGYLDLDEYSSGRPDNSYRIHSVYLDSPDLRTFQDWMNGAKNRFKLRLRYYDAQPDSPVFAEVKARVDNCVLKQRCALRREAVPLLLAGHMPEPRHLLNPIARHWGALERFLVLLHQMSARPKAHNRYWREAWLSRHDNSVRVTMDRHVEIEPWFRPEAVTGMDHPTPVFPRGVILELKFTARFPNWFRELVTQFNLVQFSSAKYAGGVVVLGESRFHDGEAAFDWRGARPVQRKLVPAAINAPAREAAPWSFHDGNRAADVEKGVGADL